MKKTLISVAMLLALVTACAPGTDIEVNTPDATIQLTTPGPNPQLNEADANGRIAGLAQGLWHGIIAPVTLVGSFFNENTQMYEVHNNGNEYNLGFLIGVALIFLILGVIGGRWR
ncbi:MAG TPA: hypothetical protein VI524_06655 [Anaerolineales bacterium]|nr:hypothetical protein [Anaerolineales bacterium]